MIMKNKTTIFIAALWTVLALCTSCTAQPGIVRGRTIELVKLAPKDALNFIQSNRNNPNFVLVDIRTPEEYSDYHIETAVNINLRSESFELDINKLDKSKTYMIYCRTGSRVSMAVKIMEKAGFTKVYGIAGDILEWKSEGLPLAK
jgi:rhodanese-related sulfurtransferase